MRMVPTPPNWPSLAIALEVGSYTPGAGIISSGARGSGIIGPGLSMILLSMMETMRPGGGIGIGSAGSHSYADGSALLMAPAPVARFFSTWTSDRRTRPDDQF